MPAAELAKYEEAVKEAGTDLGALAWLRQQRALRSALGAGRAVPADGGGGGGATGGRGVLSNVMTLADKVGVGSAARGVTSALAAGVAAGVKHLLPSRRDTPTTRALGALMENRPSADDDAYGCLDPKLGGTAAAASAAGRARAPFSHAIVFMAGPGNYLEYQAVRQSVAGVGAAGGAAGAPSRSVVYGCTEVATPVEYAAQLSRLGAAART